MVVFGTLVAVVSFVCGFIQLLRSLNIDKWESELDAKDKEQMPKYSYDLEPLYTCNQWFDELLAVKLLKDHITE